MFVDDIEYAAKVPDNYAIWGPLIEKAWAKVRGNYLQSSGGTFGEGIKAVIGCPVF
jgi:hypothetical protein